METLHRQERLVHAAGLHQPERNERGHAHQPRRGVSARTAQREAVAVLRPQRARTGDAVRRFVRLLARQEGVLQHIRQREIKPLTHRTQFLQRHRRAERS